MALVTDREIHGEPHRLLHVPFEIHQDPGAGVRFADRSPDDRKGDGLRAIADARQRRVDCVLLEVFQIDLLCRRLGRGDKHSVADVARAMQTPRLQMPPDLRLTIESVVSGTDSISIAGKVDEVIRDAGGVDVRVALN